MDKTEALEKFKQFCLKDASDRQNDLKNVDDPDADPTSVDPNEELDWHGLCIGFFLALGLSNADAWELAGEARYTHHYWC